MGPRGNVLLNKLKVFYTNCDCLTKSKLNELELLMLKLKPDIVCLTEVLPKNKILHYSEGMYSIVGYTMVTSNLDGRGICVYCKPDMKFRIIDNPTGFNEVVICEFNGPKSSFRLLTCYRSPNSSLENDSKLLDLVEHMTNTPISDLLVVGDFNYPNIDWNLKMLNTPSISASSFLDKINDLYLEQIVAEPTRYRAGQNPNMLDLVLTKDLYFVDSIDYCEPLGCSDHIILMIYVNFLDNDNDTMPKKMYYNGDYPAMNNFFESFDWVNILSEKNTQQCWDIFIDKMDYATKSFIPVRNKPSHSKPKKVWVDSNVVSNSDKKKQAWSNFWKKVKANRVNINQTDTTDLRKQYKSARNNSTNVTDDTRSAYEANIISESKHNPKAFWAYVKSRTKKPGDISVLEDSNGQLVQNDAIKSTLLNDYFSSVFVNEIDDKFFEENIIHNTENSGTIESFIITQKLISDTIDKLKVSKAPGPDGIHARVIKECKESISFIFSIIFEKSLLEGTLPRQWKQANVKALYKKGKRTACSNYRPVSLTCIVCKLFESLLRDSVMEFLEKNKLITCHQHGFRSGYSCTTQLLELMEDFTDYYEDEVPFDCIYLDFAKAFDRVPHQRLLAKIYNLGIRGDIFNWIKDFLSNREQRVVINTTYSDWTSVVSGIPQGSVLGPILFTMFINDIPIEISSHIKIFADDTKVYNKSNQCNILQDDLDKLNRWSNKWLLPFNVEKCKVIYYGKSNPNVEYIMEGKELASDTTIKDLGITFQSNLKFDEHISKITSAANSRLGIIRNTFHNVDQSGFKILYIAYVRPLLEYGTPIWSPFLRKHEKAIEQIQRRATKLIQGMKNLTYSERIVKLNLPTLYYRRRRSDMIHVFRILKQFDNIDSDSFFTINNGITRKNHIYKLDKPRCSSSQKLHSFSHRIINDWNDLPKEVGEVDSINSFKSLLEKHWKNADFKFEFKF